MPPTDTQKPPSWKAITRAAAFAIAGLLLGAMFWRAYSAGQSRQQEIESLRDRLEQSEQLRREADQENERLRERVAELEAGEGP